MPLKQKFIEETISPGNGTPIKGFEVLVTLVKLPSGAIETIVNHDGIRSKIEYINNAYDDEFKLKANPEVEIVGFVVY